MQEHSKNEKYCSRMLIRQLINQVIKLQVNCEHSLLITIVQIRTTFQLVGCLIEALLLIA